MSEFLTAVLSGIATGGIYAIVGMSYSLVYRTTGVFNFAQGDFVMLATLLAYTFGTAVGLPMVAVLVIVALLVGMLGPVVDVIAVLPHRRLGDPGMTWLISTLGVSLIIENLAQRFWGSNPLAVKSILSNQTYHLNSVVVPSPTQFLPMAAAIVVAVVYELFRRRTLTGRTFDASGEDGEAAELRKIDTRRLGIITFFLGAALAGLAGVIIGPTTFAAYNIGAGFAIYGFLAMAIGGFGSVLGAVVGGAVVGLVFGVSGLYIGSGYGSSIMLGVIVIIMLVRPNGLFAIRSERVV
ncbi:MAG: branched-chain amino acid ABC transporter permease [Acidimicrobiales bacterium]